jgi:hypothetical protein
MECASTYAVTGINILRPHPSEPPIRSFQRIRPLPPSLVGPVVLKLSPGSPNVSWSPQRSQPQNAVSGLSVALGSAALSNLCAGFRSPFNPVHWVPQPFQPGALGSAALSTLCIGFRSPFNPVHWVPQPFQPVESRRVGHHCTPSQAPQPAWKPQLLGYAACSQPRDPLGTLNSLNLLGGAKPPRPLGRLTCLDPLSSPFGPSAPLEVVQSVRPSRAPSVPPPLSSPLGPFALSALWSLRPPQPFQAPWPFQALRSLSRGLQSPEALATLPVPLALSSPSVP